MIWWSFTAMAQVVPIAPFDGDFAYSFEGPMSASCVTTTVFSACAEPSVTQSQVAGQGACTFLPRTGSELFTTGPDITTFEFPEPVRRFGAFVGMGDANVAEVRMTAFRSDGSLIGAVDRSFGDCATWEWQGLQTEGGPIGRIQITRTDAVGGRFAMDDLELERCAADDADCDGIAPPLDCADDDPATFPGAEERCDGTDNDCDGLVDSARALVADVDADGTPNACDPCPMDPDDDQDNDGICGDVDACPNGDDRIDDDGDGVANACDPCPADAPDDSDGDGVCDSEDGCPGADDTRDLDGDTVPDACDVCSPGDDRIDLNDDGVPDACQDDPGRGSDCDPALENCSSGCATGTSGLGSLGLVIAIGLLHRRRRG